MFVSAFQIWTLFTCSEARPEMVTWPSDVINSAWDAPVSVSSDWVVVDVGGVVSVRSQALN